MSGQPTPPVIVQPFGADAGAPYIQVPIPETPGADGRASFEEGFPPITMTPVIAGGIPPFGQDVNGILYMVTAHIAALQAGQPYLYSATVSAAIAGYAKGTILGMADGTGLWINQLAGNTTDPDANGANWLPVYRYGYTTINSTGGTVASTRLQAASPVIVLTGALVANLQVELPPTLQKWLIVNNTSGAFTVTVKTAAGTGVAIPAGGYGAPVEVYGDGVNLYPTVAPLTIPTAVSPTPDTYVLRDNLGNIYGAHLVATAALENPTIGAVMVQASPVDGVLRAMSQIDFRVQLFNNAALTGTVTAPTVEAGASDVRVATTQFANPESLLAGNGSFRLPGSEVQIKWGTAVAAANTSTGVTYPGTPFTGFSRPVVSGGGGVSDQDNGPAVIAATPTGFTVVNGVGNSIPFWWMAIGV